MSGVVKLRHIGSTVVEVLDDACADVAERDRAEVAEAVEEWVADLATLGAKYTVDEKLPVVGQRGFGCATPARRGAARDEPLTFEGGESVADAALGEAKAVSEALQPQGLAFGGTEEHEKLEGDV